MENTDILKQIKLPMALFTPLYQSTGSFDINPKARLSLSKISEQYDWGSFYDLINSGVEKQTLSINGTDLSISGGNTITLSAGGETRDNWVLVKDKTDLPAAIGGVITLAPNTIYEINGAIDLGSDRLVMGTDVTIRGKSPKLDYLFSTTTGALITSTTSFRIFECGFQANSGTIFDLNGTGVEICLMFGVRFFGTGGLGQVSDYDLFEVSTGLFVGYSSGLVFNGAFVTCILLDVTFYDTTGVTSVDFGTATFDSIKIGNCDFTVPNGGNALDIAPSSANINAGGAGIISGCSFNLSGSGTSTVGYTSLDNLWNVSSGNSNITPSDRILPTGWGQYSDAETTPATQTFTTSDDKLQIDGGGASSNTAYLPNAINGSGNLWDTVNDKITPISIGDSYNLRIDLEVIAKTGGVSSITLTLDIGGGVSPTIPIVVRDISVAKTPPYTLSVGFPIFCLSTFITNGGQIFLKTDTGTVTIATRSILIQRVSSGAQ